jgi:hypothetical protein
MTFKRYQELLEITAEIARRATDDFKVKVAESPDEAEAHGVKLGDSYIVRENRKFTVQEI